ncbi:putative lipid II flippase FtsW [Trebonia sp.]|uniref:putative lipid II flippase FtsW n=1 Tax=Trebonia sp. TaxID=2767075 RepID=UPI002615E206|nr:putative lipid II flippase FtsW [Trebonia sp.]
MHVRAVSDPAVGALGPDDDEEPRLRVAASGRAEPPALGALGALGALREHLRAWRALAGRPLTPYYLIVGITTLLLGLGLVMVLSTASVTDLADGLSPYYDFERQLLGIAVGLPIMWLAARSSPRLFRAAAYPLLAVSVIGLALTLIHGVGVSQNGASRWIAIGSLQFQPSELAKLALAVWGADLLARKEKLGLLADWRHLLVPLMPGTAVLALLVLVGDDLGTTFILLMVFLALLWIAGTPGRVFTALLILMGLVLLLLVVTEPYRMQRLLGYVNQTNTNPVGQNMQSIQGKYALGSGGIFGVGLGASREKWGWLPDSTSDFIFAVIGEEFGLVGTLCVTALYGGLGYAGLRVARRATDTFSRLAAAAITTWIVMQAVVNIGAVIGVLPITGVPLPLVSEGLSSVLVTMVALGMLMSFARREPGAAQALAARGPSALSRVLSWLGPRTRRARSME